MTASRGDIDSRERWSFGSALVVTGIVAGCGASGRVASSPPSEKLTQACDAFCTKRASCDAKFEKEACKARCTTSAAFRKVEALKREATNSILECLVANACDADLQARGQDCYRATAKALPTSPRVKHLCAKLEDAFVSCNATWKTPCIDDLKVFEDADLADFDECINRSCRSGMACFRSAEDKLLSRTR